MVTDIVVVVIFMEFKVIKINNRTQNTKHGP